MKIRAVSVTAFAESGISNLSPVSTAEAEASFSKNSEQESNSALSAVSMKSFAFTDGGTFISVRTLRTALIAEIIFSKSFSSAVKSIAGSYVG